MDSRLERLRRDLRSDPDSSDLRDRLAREAWRATGILGLRAPEPRWVRWGKRHGGAWHVLSDPLRTACGMKVPERAAGRRALPSKGHGCGRCGRRVQETDWWLWIEARRFRVGATRAWTRAGAWHRWAWTEGVPGGGDEGDRIELARRLRELRKIAHPRDFEVRGGPPCWAEGRAGRRLRRCRLEEGHRGSCDWAL